MSSESSNVAVRSIIDDKTYCFPPSPDTLDRHLGQQPRCLHFLKPQHSIIVRHSRIEDDVLWQLRKHCRRACNTDHVTITLGHGRLHTAPRAEPACDHQVQIWQGLADALRKLQEVCLTSERACRFGLWLVVAEDGLAHTKLGLCS